MCIRDSLYIGYISVDIMCSGPVWDLYGTPGAPRRAHFGPERPFWWPRSSSVGPGGSGLVPTAAVWSTWVGLMATTHFGLVSGLFRVPGGSKRAPFGPKCAFSAKLRPLAAKIRPNINPKVCGSWDQIWPSGALRSRSFKMFSCPLPPNFGQKCPPKIA